MSDTFVIKLDGSEVARITGEGITCGQKVVLNREKFVEEFVDDPKLLRIVRDGKSIVVWYVSSAKNVTVERA